mmetsp:Transcript_42971/g.139443  ORF Transcript_42971/g.139443 Transcript_42971/m.139443 type:complete len:203 (-) Transcript_42971:771-1379(-)
MPSPAASMPATITKSRSSPSKSAIEESTRRSLPPRAAEKSVAAASSASMRAKRRRVPSKLDASAAPSEALMSAAKGASGTRIATRSSRRPSPGKRSASCFTAAAISVAYVASAPTAKKRASSGGPGRACAQEMPSWLCPKAKSAQPRLMRGVQRTTSVKRTTLSSEGNAVRACDCESSLSKRHGAAGIEASFGSHCSHCGAA